MTTLVKDLYVFVTFANDLGLAQSHSDRTLGLNLFSGINVIMCARELDSVRQRSH